MQNTQRVFILRFILSILLVLFLFLHGMAALTDGKLGYVNGCVWYHVDSYVYNWVVTTFRYILIWSVMALVLVWVVVALRYRRRQPVTRMTTPLSILSFLAAGLLGICYMTGQTNFDYKNLSFILVVLSLVVLAVWRYDICVGRLFVDCRAWRWWPFIAGLAGCVAMLVSHFYLYRGQIVITDSQSQIAQARLLASGHFVLNISQELRDVISFPYAIRTVPSYSQYTPGYILPLTLLCVLHLPWYVFDCLFSGLFVGTLAWVTRRLRGNVASFVAVCVVLTTPFYLIVAGSLMNHLLSGMLVLLAFAMFYPLVTTDRKQWRFWPFLFGGFVLGWAVLVRPLTGLVHLGVWGAVWMCMLWNSCPPRPWRQFLRAGTAVALGGLIPLCVLLFYNMQTTGNAFVTGYQLSNPELHRLGFHGGAMPYSWIDAWNRMASSLLWSNFLVVGLGIGLLVWMFVWLALTRMTRIDKLLLALIFAQIAVYSTYQYYDLLLGPRFLFDTLPFLILLFVLGIVPRHLPCNRQATLVLGAFLFLAMGQLFLGEHFASDRYNYFITCNTGVGQRVNRCIAENPDANPLVVILKDETETEMIGRYFAPGKVWFIRREDAERARLLPELQGARFVDADTTPTAAAAREPLQY